VTSEPTQAPAGGSNAPRRPDGLDRFCGAVDRINEGVGWFWGLTILLVTAAIMYEIIARGVFGRATIWANELTVYLSAMAYLLAGGYALRYRMHVRIDLVYDVLPRQARAWADLIGIVFLILYAGTLVWIGSQMAWTSFLQQETTGTPWNPPIWIVKATIPLAGLLLLLQGIANLVRDRRAGGDAGTA